MKTLIPYISFLSATYAYELFQMVPDYVLATERSYYMLMGILFANFYMVWLRKKNPN